MDSISRASSKLGEVPLRETFLTYFFSTENKQILCTEETVLRSLLHQLLLGAPLAVTQILLKFKTKSVVTSSYTFLDSITALRDAVKAALVAVPWKATYLVFDGLDEMMAQELESFAQVLRNLLDMVMTRIAPRVLKVLLVSRPNLTLEQAMSPASISVRSERDVRHLVERRALELSRQYKLSKDFHEAIIEQVCHKAGPMFLWAILAWDELCRGATKQEHFKENLEKAMALPSTLHSLYASLLERLDGRRLDMTMKVLAWLVAATRPLHSNELRFAIAIDKQLEQWGHMKLPNYDQICDHMIDDEMLQSLCPNLILTDEDGYVRPSHASVRDFLTHPDTSPQFRFEMEKVHERVAVTLLTTLILPGFHAKDVQDMLCSNLVRTKEDMIDLAGQFYLLPYACTAWYMHSTKTQRRKDVYDAFKTFLSKPDNVKLWLMLCLYDGTISAQEGWYDSRLWWQRDNFPVPPPIHIAVFLDSTYFVERLVKDGEDINSVLSWEWNNAAPRYRRPDLPAGESVLHFQSLDDIMIRCLIGLGADINRRNGHGVSAMRKAIDSGNEQYAISLVRTLQSRPSHAQEVGMSSQTLRWAANATMLSLVQILLDDQSIDLAPATFFDEEKTALGTFLTSPLEYACLFGMEAAAKTMMQHPRMIEAQINKEEIYLSRNPISLVFMTILQGWPDLTLSALELFPVNPTAERDRDRRTILHHAALEEWHDILEWCLLRQQRSRLNIQDRHGMTAMHIAAKVRNWYALKRLVEVGADPLMEDNYGRTPAHTAAEAGSERALRIILDTDVVETNSVDQKKRTILHYLATWNMTALAERIVEKSTDCVKAKDCDGRIPAHLAALCGSAGTLSMLLATETVDINAADAYGKTLLHYAVEGGVESCIDELLWREGLNLNPLDRHLKSPLDVTTFYMDAEQASKVREQLEEAGCTPGLWRRKNPYRHAPQLPIRPPTPNLPLMQIRINPTSKTLRETSPHRSGAYERFEKKDQIKGKETEFGPPPFSPRIKS